MKSETVTVSHWLLDTQSNELYSLDNVDDTCFRLGLVRTSLLRAARQKKLLHGRWLLVNVSDLDNDTDRNLRLAEIRANLPKPQAVECRLIREGEVVHTFKSTSKAKLHLGLGVRATGGELKVRAAARGFLVELGDWIHPSRKP